MTAIDRRALLLGTAAAAGAAALPAWGQAARASAPAAAVASGGKDAQLDALLTRQFYEALEKSPEQASALGIDTGERANLRAELSDRSQRAADEERADLQRRYVELQRLGPDGLGNAAKVNYDVAEFRLRTGAEGAQRFRYGAVGGRVAPYVLSQLSGAYYSVPDFLDNQHKIETQPDVDAYFSRLQAFATGIDGDTQRLEHDTAAGVIPPDFVLEKTIGNVRMLRDADPASTVLVTSVSRRAREKGLADPSAQATRIVAEQIRPALGRQLEALEALRARANHEAGAWKLPQGRELYAHGLKTNTTTDLTAEQIHQLGLEQVADLHGRIDVILRGQGLSQGTVGERLNQLNRDPQHLYPNTEAGRTELLAALNAQMADINTRLPRMFSTLARSPLEIRRVPPTIEAGAPGGYYQRPSLDGSRPGAYYINLKDTAEWPKWSLKTLTYHEGSPGHHFQGSIQQEAGELPIYRRTGGFAAASEGWGLYAERVADELGVYENDPLGKVGYLQSYLFRAVRLVVDTGLHDKRWSREQAIRYMVDNAGEPEGSAVREIERYAVWPGQATAYKVGEITVSRLRSDAERRLGSRFDIKGFHDVLLLTGSVPLSVLEAQVNAWAATRA